MNCTCCGAKLIVDVFCNETFLCSKNGCFLRWLTSKEASKDLGSLDVYLCGDWRCTHDSGNPESD